MPPPAKPSRPIPDTEAPGRPAPTPDSPAGEQAASTGDLGPMPVGAAFPKPYIRTAAGRRSLHFSPMAVQSTMSLQHPERLLLHYTRTMMGFLLFKPAPGSVAMIGLGGGSLPKFCHRYLPHTRVVVVEINPHVLALRDQFALPPDDLRLQVCLGDGAFFVRSATERFDVLLLDGYQTLEMPTQLCSQRFYRDCHERLEPEGILVANLHALHPRFGDYVARISEAFGGRILWVSEADATNCTVFAFKGALPSAPAEGRLQRPPELPLEAWQQIAGAMQRLANSLQAAGRLP